MRKLRLVHYKLADATLNLPKNDRQITPIFYTWIFENIVFLLASEAFRSTLG